MNKSKAAFIFNLHRLFEGHPQGYLWTFTFPDLPDFPEARQRWRKLVNWLKRAFDDTVSGLRVYELHETHGIHIHAVFNRRVAVQLLRPAAQRYGFGRIHVKRINREGAGYLAKYLGKQDRSEWLKGQRLWAGFGPFQKLRVKDVICDCSFTRAIKFCQAELKRSKLPFWFVNELMQCPTEDPVRLKLACKMVRESGPYIMDIRRVLMC